ncbi:MAG: DUF6359 domain-containing protein [Bacteroidales bacterium]
MKGIFLFGGKLRLFREWSKLIGFSRAVKLFFSEGGLLSFTPFLGTLLGTILFLQGCQGLTFTEESKGELKLMFGYEYFTKAVVREFPDSNSFILSIKSSTGTVIYNGTYGERPANLELNAGSYDVSICSRLFVTPEFDAACYSDSKTVIIQSGKVYLLALTCRQSNVGLRLSFTPEFMARFAGYKPEVADSKGTLEYPFNETRFAYLNPGTISIILKEVLPAESTDTSEVIPILDRVVTARDMLTINLHANPEDSTKSAGIIIDTTSNWVFEYIVIGDGGDGATKESAFTVDQLAQNIGKTGVWVTGYIVGGDLTTTKISFEAPFGSDTNMAIAASPTVRDRTKCVSVAIPTGTIRDLLGLSANPTNLGKKVYLKGTIVAAYQGITGLNPINAAQF